MYNNQSQNDFGQRKMYQGHWTCSGCGAEITELPFEPDGTRPIYCRDCHRQRQQDRPKRRF
ncbi:MAG: CxxC-x17-CxxC domain-containing protein [bacterium]